MNAAVACTGAGSGLANENELGVEDAGAEGDFVSPPLANGELTAGALENGFGADDDAPIGYLSALDPYSQKVEDFRGIPI